MKLDRALGIRLPTWLMPLGLIVIVLSVVYGVKGEAPPSEGEEDQE